jgi:hypothetical protein
MTTVKIVGRWLMGLFVLACALTACVARLNERGAPASQAEPQVVTPQPATVQPAESPTEASVIITEVVVIDPATDPFVATLTAIPVPATPTPTPIGYDPPEGPTASPTPTMSRVINMAEGLPDGEIYVAIIRRADGTYEQYYLPIQPLAEAENFLEAQSEMLNLGPQDTFVNGYTLATPPPRLAPLSQEQFDATATANASS